MENTIDESVRRKTRIVLTIHKVYFSILVLILLLNLLAVGKITNSISSFLMLVLPIILMYQVSKRTLAGYQTARTWLIILFLGSSATTKFAVDNQYMFYEIVAYLIIIAIYVTSFFLINSICKEFSVKKDAGSSSAEFNQKITDVSSQNVTWKNIKPFVLCFIGLICIFILIAIFQK